MARQFLISLVETACMALNISAESAAKAKLQEGTI